MNSKRQTIWLVSMLSLMVVLSAYYLFTEDSGTSKTPVADSQQVDSKTDKDAKTTASAGSKDNGVVVDEVVTSGQSGDKTADAGKADGSAAKDTAQDPSKEDAAKDTAAAGSTADKDAAAKDTAKDTAAAGQKSEATTDKAADGKTASTSKTDAGKTTASTEKTDDEILQEVASQASSGSSMLESLQWQRSQTNAQKTNDLMASINDMSKDSEASAKASQELQALENKETIIESIEEELEQKFSFANAFVKEDDDKYQVLVLSDKMDAKQAAGIVQLVMKELKVTQDKVSVKVVSE
ncbi:stage III sporulation protein AH [Paenibacillus rhizosphaerae]|uniref:Stage III sporulation protein AH n=1 Tax=Paenibacillus rhizosphaerae TaxID=297318 RepID=A0A839TS49_9BACL|nr:SpoIIIAH-like family protein [Paenibacillus rhizosphaerae]MBB3127557.1 stage III sporulation protein AH [Paenibacillus rhizosphaerae]